MSFSALAVMPAYDEADIIRWTVEHLICQGIQVYVIDNWSKDGTWEMLPDLPLVGFERFPDTPPSSYLCRAIHDRIDDVLAASDADWCIFHDADEIRRSPIKDEPFLDALERTSRAGYTAIDHRLYHFVPVDNGYKADPENYFRYYHAGHIDSKNFHVKAWKNQHHRVGIGAWETGGGHRVNFPGCRVSPERFILKHYPIRSQAHGEAKIKDRLSRWDAKERARGWHIQYDGMEPPFNFLGDPSKLQLWDGTESSVVAPRRITILTLTRFPEIFRRLACSLHRWSPPWASKVVVTSGGVSLGYFSSGWKVIQGLEPFSFSRNFNLGVLVSEPDSDILFINDDAILRNPHGIQKLSDLAYSASDIGVVSPQVARGAIGNPLQHVRSRLNGLTFSDLPLAFVCVYIKREAFDRIGFLDELFDGYGSDDTDWCLRAVAKGYKLAVTPEVLIDHGFGTHPCSSSYLASSSPIEISNSMLEMKRRLKEKWSSWEEPCPLPL